MAEEDFNATSLSEAMAMSRMQLHRKVSALTGTSPAQYLRSIRMQRAQELLKRTDLPVGEVAVRVGFKEHATFTRTYKEAFGKLPSER